MFISRLGTSYTALRFTILSLYSKIRVGENPYSRIFYAVLLNSAHFTDQFCSVTILSYIWIILKMWAKFDQEILQADKSVCKV